MISIYDCIMSPLESAFLRSLREKIMPCAHGSVLEIGIGTGANLPFYKHNKITRFTALDTNISGVLRKKSSNLHFVKGNAEALPFPNNTFDTVVSTLVLCSVADLSKSISEIHRVLKPGGKYIFIEHVLPHDPKLAGIFHSVNPVWCKLAHGCNLNRRTHRFIKEKFPQLNAGSVGNGIFCYGVART